VKGCENVKSKDYFLNVKRLNATVNAKIEKVQLIRKQLESIGCVDYSKDIVSGSHSDSQICDGVAKLIDFENELSKQIEELCSLQSEAIQRIDSMIYADYRLVLTLRYLNSKTWEQIAVDMGFTFQWVQELNKRALIQFDELFFEKVQELDCN
jgi:DNA-directed RNA polymerase specialized sigma subunit